MYGRACSRRSSICSGCGRSMTQSLQPVTASSQQQQLLFAVATRSAAASSLLAYAARYSDQMCLKAS